MRFQPLVARFFRRTSGLLLHLLPKSFRREYGEQLLLVIEDLLRESRDLSCFTTAAIGIWSLWDVARLAFREHLRSFLNRHNLTRHPCTPRAQAVLALADQEAVRFGIQQPCDEHILLGLLCEGGGIAAFALRGLGLDADRVRNAIDVCRGMTPQLLPAGRASEVLASARANAVGLGHRFLGTEHVLLGMLVDPQQSLETVLANLGVTCEQVRRETLAVLTQAPNFRSPNAPRSAAAVKTMILVVIFVLFLIGSRLLAQTSAKPIPQNDTAQAQGPGEQNQRDVAKDRTMADPGQYHIEEVEIPLEAARPLKGTLVVPVAEHRVPAMLVIPGYGRTDEEPVPHSQTREDAGIELGRYLAQRGIAVLRVPFGSGPSGSEPDLSVEALADRAAQCVGYLKGRPEIDPKRIGILGHSAGGAVAMLAASKSSDLAFFVTAASPVESAQDTVFEMLEGVLCANGATKADRTAARNLQQHIFDALARGATPEELRPNVQKLIRAIYAGFPKGHPALAGGDPEQAISDATERRLKTLTSPWFRGLLGFDPAAALAKVQCPTLILFAEKDPKIDSQRSREIAKAALKKAGQKRSDVRVIAGADHSFEVQTAGGVSAERQTHHRFSPEFLNALTSWTWQ